MIESILDPVNLATKDVRRILKEQPIGTNEARLLVDLYYQVQKARVGTSNRINGLIRDAVKRGEAEEPHELMDLLLEQFHTVEENIATGLKIYTKNHEMFWFFDATVGIGPVLSAGILAHIDINKAPTVGHIWRFAGLDPTLPRAKKGEKRRYNSALKTICWKAGESFVKTSGHEDGFYGRLYKERKQLEWERNLRGEYAEQAEAALIEKNYGKTTDAYAWYSGLCSADLARKSLAAGKTPSAADCKEDDGGLRMLPPAHIHERATRYARKIFLSHLHECWWEQTHPGEKAPVPWIIAHGNHGHRIYPPQRAGRKD